MHKSYDMVQVKAGPSDDLPEGTFEAYASVFGNVDSYGDVVQKGAFAADLIRWEKSGNPIPLLYGHEFNDPDYNIGHIVEAKEDDHGLYVKAQFDMESPKAAQVYRLVKSKRLTQLSFAYEVEDYEYDEKQGVVLLKQLKLHEVSLVPLGANQETEVLSVKDGLSHVLAEMKAGRSLSAKTQDVIAQIRDLAQGLLESAAPNDASDNESEEAKSDESEKTKDDDLAVAKSRTARASAALSIIRNRKDRS